jgi:hypothetical protein
MSRHWIEQGQQPMPLGSAHTEQPRSEFAFRGSEVRNTYYVNVCSFTFRFVNLQQLQLCLAYYQRKTHPTSRLPFSSIQYFVETGQRGWEVERWFERLPQYLLENGKRERVCSALEKAYRDWNNDSQR